MKQTISKTVSLLLIFLMLVSLLSQNVFAADSCEFRYSNSHEGGAIIIDYLGNSNTISIPSSIAGKPVVSIGYAAFAHSLQHSMERRVRSAG